MNQISVITPAYKASETIAETVKSVIAQSYENWEQIIISDDSFDYESFLKEQGIFDKRLRFLSTGKVGAGPSVARNIAIKNATSDFIALLDADDLFAPQKLEIIAPRISKYPFISCAMQIMDFDNRPILITGKTDSDKVLRACEYKKINYSSDSMLVFDRSKLKNFYSEEIHYLEDLQFVLSAFESIGEVLHCGQTLHFYLKKPTSLSNGEAAGNQFIKIKNQIIEDLQNDKYHFVDLKTKDAILEFLSISKKAEEEFIRKRKANPKLIFEEVLKNY